MSRDSTIEAGPGTAFEPMTVDESSPGVHLTVIDGPDRDRSVWASPDGCVLGTHKSCDLTLEDPTVSRFHCELRGGPRGFSVRDLESKNGTFLDAVPVIEGLVRDGSKLRLGETTLRLALQKGVRQRLYSRRPSFGMLLGRSLAMRSIFAVLERAAPTDSTILIQGETGTGKEVAALSIHEASPRADGPFVPLNCASLAVGIAESELFGHVRGAFSGAEQDRAGAFRAADGGTLFLDELGELPLEIQAKLLRVIETGRVRPMGATEEVPFDVRLVAATHRDLRKEVNLGTFREDLFYRLAVIVIRLPALRERPEDIPMLAERLLDSMGRVDLVNEERMARIAKMPWPGNVRQLRNHFHALAALGTEAAGMDMSDDTERLDLPYDAARQAALRRFERRYLSALLERAGDNVTEAAKLGRLNRAYLHKLLSRTGLRGD